MALTLIREPDKLALRVLQIVKLLTYNIHYWEGTDGVTDVDRTIDVIRASEADLIGLNEVYHPAQPAGLPQAALIYMAEQLQMQVAFGQAQATTLAFDDPATRFGNALLSRWPILASAAHHLPPVAGHDQRGLLEARVLLPDKRRTLTIYVTHLDPRAEDVRHIQVQGLLTWASRDRHQPHVLMGDLNTYSEQDWCGLGSEDRLREVVAQKGWDYYPAHVLPRLLKSGYVDTWIEAGVGEGATYEAPDARFRIDYLFLSTPLAAQLVSCRRWDADPASTASDHYPVLVELDY